MDSIYVNIWDDYYGDDEKELQETHIQVEDLSVSHSQEKEILKLVLDFLKTQIKSKKVELELIEYDSKKEYPNMDIKSTGFKHYKQWRIKVLHLTHKQRESLLIKWENNPPDLKFKKRPIDFISES